MSGLKTIRRRIASVKNTKQITRAMKLVSAAKLRRAQEAAVHSRSFSDRLGSVFRNVVLGLPSGFSHPLFEAHEEVKVRRIVVFSGDRGLCGAYNTNMVKAIAAREGKDGAKIEFVTVGRKAVSVLTKSKGELVQKYESLSDDAGKWPIREIGERLIKDFVSGACDEVIVYYTKFISTMTQSVVSERLLPFAREEFENSAAGPNGAPNEIPAGPQKGQIKYDPEPAAILSYLVPLLIKTKLMQSALEAKASEHAARMTAMDSATRNADELIDRLRLFYNRARQSAITRELMDIIGGAEAQK